jgi:hypothetical protein
MCHAAKALGGKAQAVDVLARPLPFCQFSSSSLKLNEE